MKEATEAISMQFKSHWQATLATGATWVSSLGGLFLSSIDWVNSHDKFCLVVIAALSFLAQIYFKRREQQFMYITNDRRKPADYDGNR